MDEVTDSMDYMRYILIPVIIMMLLDTVSNDNSMLIYLRALQLIIVQAVFRVTMPANMVIFTEVSLKIAMFDFVEEFFDWDA